MIEFTILARGCYRPEQLLVRYDTRLTMPITPESQARMDELWQRKLIEARSTGKRLFDAPLYRYISLKQEVETLALTLGNTSYKEYVTTRERSAYQAHKEPGNPLAVCSVVETSDGYILLDRRQGVDVYNGRYHVIGGFFERDLDTSEQQQPDPWAAIRREIREETGIQVSDIERQYCLGVVYDTTMPHAELCFLTRLHISRDEVVGQRQPEEDEIKELQTLHVSSTSLRDFIVQNHGNISATGEPNLLFYGAWKYGEQWYTEVLKKIC